ncbi:MAG: GPR endopeptidase [Clostridia bacterium]|nr:GPR endopeptidase [Clostridia bacterium]
MWQTNIPESDLACERRRADTSIPGVEYKKEKHGGFTWEKIRITSEEGARSIGRPIGHYDTLTTPRMDKLDAADIEDAQEELARELCIILDGNGIYPERLLVVGLGNRSLTPDSIGPKCAERINPTMHIMGYSREMFESLDCSEIAVCTPGVTAQSGMEAADTVRGICNNIKPDAVIAIDALASRSSERLGSTIQISDTGIFPGSGIGNRRSAINRASVGVPVIAIGVPTVIDTRVFINEEMSLILEREVSLRKNAEPMFVSPREANEITDCAARIIAGAINQAFGTEG